MKEGEEWWGSNKEKMKTYQHEVRSRGRTSKLNRRRISFTEQSQYDVDGK